MDDEVPAISGCLALALVDAVYRVVAAYLLAQGVELDVSFALVAVGVDDKVGCRVRGVAEPQDGTARAACELGANAHGVETHGIVGGSGNLGAVAEGSGAALGERGAEVGGWG